MTQRTTGTFNAVSATLSNADPGSSILTGASQTVSGGTNQAILNGNGTTVSAGSYNMAVSGASNTVSSSGSYNTIVSGQNTTINGSNSNATIIGGHTGTMTIAPSAKVLIKDTIFIAPQAYTASGSGETISAANLVSGVIILTDAQTYTLPTTANLATQLGITSSTFTTATNRVVLEVTMRMSGGFSQTATIALGTGQDWTNKTTASSITLTGAAVLRMEFIDANNIEITVLEAGGGGGGSSETEETVTTSNATPTTIGTAITPANNSVTIFIGRLTAIRTDVAGEYAAYELKAFFQKNGSTLTQLGTDVITEAESASAGTWDVTTNVSSPSFSIQVTGQAAKTINWKLTYKTYAS